jgi:hypothetical protein
MVRLSVRNGTPNTARERSAPSAEPRPPHFREKWSEKVRCCAIASDWHGIKVILVAGGGLEVRSRCSPCKKVRPHCQPARSCDIRHCAAIATEATAQQTLRTAVLLNGFSFTLAGRIAWAQAPRNVLATVAPSASDLRELRGEACGAVEAH